MDINVRGRLRLDVFKNGVKTDSFEDDNLVVLSGKQILTFLLAGEPGNHRITKVGVGENTDSPYFTDTTLTNGFIKNVDGYTLLEPTVVQWNFSIDPGEANGKTIAEYALFSTEEQMFARKTRIPAIPKDNSISFSGDWTIFLVECKKINFTAFPTITWNTASDLDTEAEKRFSSTPIIGHSITTDLYRYDQFVGGEIAEPGTDTFEDVDSGDEMYK